MEWPSPLHGPLLSPLEGRLNGESGGINAPPDKAVACILDRFSRPPGCTSRFSGLDGWSSSLMFSLLIPSIFVSSDHWNPGAETGCEVEREPESLTFGLIESLEDRLVLPIG